MRFDYHKRWLLLWVLILYSSACSSFSISNSSSETDLSPDLKIIQGNYTFEEIHSGKYDSLFTNNIIPENASGGYDKNVWAKINLESTGDNITSWILKTDKQYGEVTCYIIYPDGKAIVQKSGWFVPPARRDVVSPDVIFNFPLSGHQNTIVYLYIHTNLRWSTIDGVKATLYSADYWNRTNQSKNLFLAFYAGICLLAMFYWFITYIYSLRINYVYLILASLSPLLFYLDYYGLLTSLAFNNDPLYSLSKYGTYIIWICFFGWFNLLLADRLNSFQEKVPRLTVFLYLSAVITTVYILASPFFLPWKFSHLASYGFCVTTWICYYILSFLWLKKKNKSVGFAILAYAPVIVTVNLFFLSLLGFISEKIISNLIAPAGALLSVVLLFYGMVNYIIALRTKREKEHLEKEQLVIEHSVMLEKKVEERTRELEIEKNKSDELLKKSDELLLNILPSEIAMEIKQQGRSQAKTFSMVTVMFTDFKDFTEVSEKISGELLVAEIDYCFSAFDNIIQKYGVEKIKTVGDAYVCVGGMPVLTFTHAVDTVNAAIEIRNFMLRRKKEKEEKGEIPFEIRIGIHTGPVVAGIVGVRKFAYDIWGDTVNLAARMESHGEAGKINISGTTYQLVKEKFSCTHRGKIQAKHKGEVDMYFVEKENYSVSLNWKSAAIEQT